MNLPLTSEQLMIVYQAITSQNPDFVRAMAQCAISTSAEVKADMWSHDDSILEPPSSDDVRDMAIEYFGDMLVDFKRSFAEVVQQIGVDIAFELVPTVKFRE